MATELQTALHLATRVGLGHKIEIETPQLAEGEPVDVFVVATRPTEVPNRTILDFFGSTSAAPRSAASWKAFEEAFQEERNAWGR